MTGTPPRAIGQVLDGHPPFCLCRACDDAAWEVEKRLLARRPPQTGTRLRAAHATRHLHRRSRNLMRLFDCMINYRPRLTTQERVISAFATGCFVGSIVVAGLVAYGLLRVTP